MCATRIAARCSALPLPCIQFLRLRTAFVLKSCQEAEFALAFSSLLWPSAGLTAPSIAA